MAAGHIAFDPLALRDSWVTSPNRAAAPEAACPPFGVANLGTVASETSC